MSEFKYIDYRTYGNRVADFAAGLVQLGLKRQGSLAVFEETRLEWTLACQAAFRQGMQLLTVYANLGEDALAYSLDLAKSEHLLCNGSSLGMLSKIQSKIPSLKTVIVLDKFDDKAKESLQRAGLTVITFAQVEENGRKNPIKEDPPQPDDVALCMFTSGTTGNPKGVLLTHRNIVAAISACYVLMAKQIGVYDTDVYCSFLPLAHILAFVLHFVAALLGARIGFGVRPDLLFQTSRFQISHHSFSPPERCAMSSCTTARATSESCSPLYLSVFPQYAFSTTASDGEFCFAYMFSFL
jgi:long-chain acyl-CoA synthetase